MDNTLEIRRERNYQLYLSIVLGLFFVLYMYTAVDSVAPAVYALKFYAPPVIFSVIACNIYRNGYGWKRVYTLGLLFLAWYTAGRIVLGDRSLMRSVVNLMDLCVVYGLVFPFAHVAKDGQKHRVLDILSLAYIVAMAVVCWIGIYLAIVGEQIIMPVTGRVYGIDNGRLALLGQGCNTAAPMVCIALFLTLYLLAKHWKKIWIVPAAVLLITFYLALGLTDSRTAILSFVVALVWLSWVLAHRLPLSNQWLKLGSVVLLMALALLLGLKGPGISNKIVSYVAREVRQLQSESGSENAAGTLENFALVHERDIELSADALSGRDGIYRGVLLHIKNSPSVLIFGTLDAEVMNGPGYYNDENYHVHAHSSYFQVLLLAGLPALLVMLWICLRVALAALKLLAAKAKLADNILCVIPIYFMVSSLAESLVFVPFDSLCWSHLNFWFLLICGYAIEMGDQYKLREVFAQLKPRKPLPEKEE